MQMYVGCLIVDFHIPATASLKDKRSIVKSNIQRAQQRFNASIVELADHDLWRRATIGAAACGAEPGQIEGQLRALLSFLEADPRWEALRVDFTWR
jgi:uncharacterized protein YlxP (DUF503 family)